ncbi:hypothetical protein Tco_0300041 [Tanacetum coccineum]
MLRACVIDFGNGWEGHLPLIKFLYNNSYHASLKAAAPFKRHFNSAKVSSACGVGPKSGSSLTGPELVHETTEKIVSPWKTMKVEPEVYRTFQDEIHIDDKLHFVEELVEILDREVKKLRRSRIPIIKVRWNSKNSRVHKDREISSEKSICKTSSQKHAPSEWLHLEPWDKLPNVVRL